MLIDHHRHQRFRVRRRRRWMTVKGRPVLSQQRYPHHRAMWRHNCSHSFYWKTTRMFRTILNCINAEIGHLSTAHFSCRTPARRTFDQLRMYKKSGAFQSSAITHSTEEQQYHQHPQQLPSIFNDLLMCLCCCKKRGSLLCFPFSSSSRDCWHHFHWQIGVTVRSWLRRARW